MRFIGLDPGQVRCGVAVSDPLGILASPVAVLPVEPRLSLARRLAEALATHGGSLEHEPYGGLVCGLAYDERGREGESARLGRELAELVYEGLLEILRAAQSTSPGGDAETAGPEFGLHFRDERFSTADMQRRRSEAGVNLRRQKGEIDAWAAAAVLQDFLDQRRSQTA